MTTTPFPFPTADHHEPPAKVDQPEPIQPTEKTLDHGVEESFPASDPVSVSFTKVDRPKVADDQPGAGVRSDT